MRLRDVPYSLAAVVLVPLCLLACLLWFTGQVFLEAWGDR